ncbi:MAG: hypothetical protein JW884_13720 [Deltaproteobacteria bacterium]|nr:hypothetical protein [Deltaproteobacteria bacterium]
MPKYRHKQNLKRIIESGRELGPLSSHLILQGRSYDEAMKGLEPYVSHWEESVKYIEEMSVDDIAFSEEYDHDLSARFELYNVLKYASEEEIGRYRNRIDKADQAFKECTVESNFSNKHIKDPDKLKYWWLIRRKKY